MENTMSQKKVLVVLFEVPEEIRAYILPEDAPELPKLREIAVAGVHGNGYYKNDDKKKALSYDLVKLFYANEEEDSDLAPMTKYRVENFGVHVSNNRRLFRGDHPRVSALDAGCT